MKNTVKVKKRDALKPFSIVAGVLFILLAISIIFSNTALFLAQYRAAEDSTGIVDEESVEASGEVSAEESENQSADNSKKQPNKIVDVINIVLSYVNPIITALLLIAAAVIFAVLSRFLPIMR